MRHAEKVNVFEMKCLECLVGMSRMDIVRNGEMHRNAGIERELVNRIDQRVLRWFGHVESMDDYRMARKVLMAEASRAGTRATEVRLDGWCNSGLGQERNDGGG